MPHFPLVLPTTSAVVSSDGVAFARRLGTLRGPAVASPDASRNAADLLARGEALAAARATNLAALDEAFVHTATHLLTEWERIYRVPAPSSDTATRRAALVARTRARRGNHPTTIVAAILGIAGTSASVTEIGWSLVTADPKWVFNIVVRVDQNVYLDAAQLAQVDDVVQRMKPAHAIVTYTGMPTTGFLADDGNSLTDNTVLAT